MKTTLDGIRDVKVYQNVDGYRFSVDALLLYSFVNVRYAHNIADLGTGSGIIGLLLAKKYEKAEVLLVELQDSLYRLARKNVKINGLEERVGILHTDIRNLRESIEAMAFDVAVSNPPFRKPGSGRLSEGEERSAARHETMLPLDDLVKSAAYILKSKGRFFMIYLPERMVELFDCMRTHRLEPKRIRFVYNNCSSVSKIMMVEAVRDGKAGLKVEKPLVIYEKDGSYTREMQHMYGLI